ncbi:MAG: hypothetical protein A2798_03610 [Candidatus Levybacteria bacterium RIFCSPHIGHO2_01_FULL_37_17]|nr:MAG: hypothetical protein A2798_03610 [Candidatus Levybacteria bacterium RIFCSPHIGHO2_01_FULL_37_17]OGH36561.1 MAG: hypothetical protein A2959_03665 [Candidatus Levybacteria bacterium RIFCSPLOWO2_01_FULL_38_23]
MEDLQEQLAPIFKRFWLPIVLALIALMFFAYGMISLLSKSSTPQVRFETVESLQAEAEIAVDIEGAVVKPGVYKLKSGSIVQEALIAAGGASEDADREWMAKNLNLALKLTNGQKIYIPKLGETGTISVIQDVESNSTALININTASSSELDTLPGIGPVTSTKIIDNRPYNSINDLLDKKIVGQSTFEKIKDKITTL